MRAGDTIEQALTAAGRDLARLERLAGQSPDWAAYLAGGTETIERDSNSIQVESV